MAGSKKYSISLPEELAQAVRENVGPGGFSAYVAEALEHRLAMDRLNALVEDFATDNDPLTAAEMDAARAALAHHRTAPERGGGDTGGTGAGTGKHAA